MNARPILAIMALVLVTALVVVGLAFAEETEGEKPEMKKMKMAMPFGGEKDVAFAEALWTGIDGYHDWMMQSDIMPGKSPHGMFVRLYYNIVSIEGMPYHVVVKDNYGGEDVTLDMVNEAPDDYLMAVTPMVQREPGYDDENNNWFYAKYDPAGAVSMNDKGMAMAGRVAKGMPIGCIACHTQAADGDYLFAND